MLTSVNAGGQRLTRESITVRTRQRSSPSHAASATCVGREKTMGICLSTEINQIAVSSAGGCMPHDWLFDGGRRATATERIYATATELIYRDGMDAFNVDALAAATHCSRATIYRYVGGKKDIREAVLARAATRIVETCGPASRDGPVRTGSSPRSKSPSRKSAPIPRARCSWTRPAGVGGIGWPRRRRWPTSPPNSPDSRGDAPAARWIVRLVLSLLFWPDTDPTPNTRCCNASSHRRSPKADETASQTASSRSKNSR